MGPTYYGGFLLDSDGNSARPYTSERARPVPTAASTACLDPVADLAASKRFYATVAPTPGYGREKTGPGGAFTGGTTASP